MSAVAGTRYAILLSGMSYSRHANDLEFLYRTLRNVYSVPPANIYVLNYDGTMNYDGGPGAATGWAGDGSAYTMQVSGQGTKADFEGVIDDLKTRMSAADSLLIHTNNHGAHDGTESNLCTYPIYEAYAASDFAAKLAELPAFRCLMVMMEQCRAGGFNARILESSPASMTSIACAATEFRDSAAPDSDFDPFARDWISAFAGAALDGTPLTNLDTNSDGRVGAREVFDHADTVRHAADSPVYSAAPASADGCHFGVPPDPQLLTQYSSQQQSRE